MNIENLKNLGSIPENIDEILPKLIQQYQAAIVAYDAGEPIMSDPEFDELRQYLEMLKVDLSELHQPSGYGTKHPHWTPMVSLHSLHVDNNFDQNVINAIAKFFNEEDSITDARGFVWTWKYDGIAISAQYDQGKLLRVLTRGTYYEGFDITDNFGFMFPAEITNKAQLEVRGELVIKRKLFEQKYAKHYANERNYVGGVARRKADNRATVEELNIAIFRIIRTEKDSNGANKHIHLLPLHQDFEQAFNNQWLFIPSFTASNVYNLQKDYSSIVQQRELLEYRTDGIVLGGHLRHEIKGHIYLGSLALKFLAKDAVTTIKSIEWRWSLNGEARPVGILEPVDLDGSTVSRVSLFNYNKMVANGWFPGAKIRIVKSGDIIPHIVETIEKVVAERYTNPDLLFTKQGIRHIALFRNDSGAKTKKFIDSVLMLSLADVGVKMAIALYDAGITTVTKLFEITIDQKSFAGYDIELPESTQQRILGRLTDRLTSIHLEHLIKVLRIPAVGHRMADEAANLLSNLRYDSKGFNKDAWQSIFTNPELLYLLENYHSNISFKYDRQENLNDAIVSVHYVMTGSPKSAGFATKGEFKAMLPSDWKEHNMSHATVLITDDYDSTSGKMKQAKAKNMEIVTYCDLVQNLQINQTDTL